MSGAGITSKLTRGATLIGGAKLLTMAVSLASTVVLARLLVPEDFGIIAIAMTLMVVVSAVSELSLSSALIQMKTVEDDHYHTAFTLGLIRAVVIALALLAAAGPIAAFYGDERLVEVIRAFGLASLVGGAFNPRLVDYTRRLDFRPEVVVLVTERVAGFVIAVTAAILLRSYWAFVLSFAGAQAVRLVVTYFLKPYRPRLSLSRVRDILSFSVWITLGNWVQTLNWRADPLVLGYFLPISALGQYQVADRITQMTTREVVSPIAQVLFPAFSRMQDDPARLRRGYLDALTTLTAVAFPIAAGLALVADPLVHVALGEKWTPLIPYMQLLCVVALINPVEQIQPVAMAVGQTRALFRRDVRALLVRMPLLVGGILVARALGHDMVVGAIVGRVVGVAINRLWNMQLIASITAVSVADHFAAIARPALSAAVMTGTLVGVASLDDYQATAPLGQLALLVCLGGAVYAASSLAVWTASGRPGGPERLALKMLDGLWGRLRRSDEA